MARRRKKEGTMNNDEQPQGYVAPELQEETATNDAVAVAEVVTQQPTANEDTSVEVVNQVNTPEEEAEAQDANERQSTDRFAGLRGKTDEEMAEMGVPAPSRPRNQFPQADVDPLEQLQRYRDGLANEGDDEIVG